MIAEVIAAPTILVKVGDCPCGNHMTGLEDSRAAEDLNRVLSQVNPFSLTRWCDMRRIAGPLWISGPQPSVAGADNLDERQRQDGISTITIITIITIIIVISLEAHSHQYGMSLNILCHRDGIHRLSFELLTLTIYTIVFD